MLFTFRPGDHQIKTVMRHSFAPSDEAVLQDVIGRRWARQLKRWVWGHAQLDKLVQLHKACALLTFPLARASMQDRDHPLFAHGRGLWTRCRAGRRAASSRRAYRKRLQGDYMEPRSCDRVSGCLRAMQVVEWWVL